MSRGNTLHSHPKGRYLSIGLHFSGGTGVADEAGVATHSAREADVGGLSVEVVILRLKIVAIVISTGHGACHDVQVITETFSRHSDELTLVSAVSKSTFWEECSCITLSRLLIVMAGSVHDLVVWK